MALVRVWNGSSWIVSNDFARPKVWDGSGWQFITPRFWTGSGWNRKSSETSRTITIGNQAWSNKYIGGTYYGYSDNAGFGSFSNRNTMLYDCALIEGVFCDVIDTGGINLHFQISVPNTAWHSDGISNDGWTSMTVGSSTFTRSSASSFSGNENYGSWRWDNIGSNVIGGSGTQTVYWS